MSKELERIELSLYLLKKMIQPTIYKGLKKDIYTIEQALKRAKKVEELLDLYRLQHEFKERYNTSVRLLDQQECLDTIREIAEEIYLKEKELEELK